MLMQLVHFSVGKELRVAISDLEHILSLWAHALILMVDLWLGPFLFWSEFIALRRQFLPYSKIMYLNQFLSFFSECRF